MRERGIGLLNGNGRMRLTMQEAGNRLGLDGKPVS